MADYPAGTPASADLALCLSFGASPATITALRLRLLQGGWDPILKLAADLRLLPALAENVAAKGLAAGIPQRRGSSTASVSAVLDDAAGEHAARSIVLEARLKEILDVLAARGLRPLLLKGARALWVGKPHWRTLRDLDLLVPAPATAAAIEAVLAAGYHPNTDFAAPAGWHHDAELYRDDLPGWLEVHARGGVRRIEALLPTPWLMAKAEDVPARTGGPLALLMPMPLHILYCLAHHHIGHRGDYYGEVEFKGLYEFAADVAALAADERQKLLDAASIHPRLIAMLDLWLAAAEDLFQLPINAPLHVAPDARRHWGHLSREVVRRAAVGTPPRRYEGLAVEVLMSMNAARLRTIPIGRTVLGRLRLRTRAFSSLVAKAAIASDNQ